MFPQLGLTTEGDPLKTATLITAQKDNISSKRNSHRILQWPYLEDARYRQQWYSWVQTCLHRQISVQKAKQSNNLTLIYWLKIPASHVSDDTGFLRLLPKRRPRQRFKVEIRATWKSSQLQGTGPTFLPCYWRLTDYRRRFNLPFVRVFPKNRHFGKLHFRLLVRQKS